MRVVRSHNVSAQSLDGYSTDRLVLLPGAGQQHRIATTIPDDMHPVIVEKGDTSAPAFVSQIEAMKDAGYEVAGGHELTGSSRQIVMVIPKVVHEAREKANDDYSRSLVSAGTKDDGQGGVDTYKKEGALSIPELEKLKPLGANEILPKFKGPQY